MAVHGLGGSWDKSWTDLRTGHFWLRDSLPRRLPDSRVLSYGYKATTKATSRSMEEIAAKLLAELLELRGSTDVRRDDRDLVRNRTHRFQSQRRPLLFLAHSIGGPLLKGVRT